MRRYSRAAPCGQSGETRTHRPEASRTISSLENSPLRPRSLEKDRQRSTFSRKNAFPNSAKVEKDKTIHVLCSRLRSGITERQKPHTNCFTSFKAQRYKDEKKQQIKNILHLWQLCYFLASFILNI